MFVKGQSKEIIRNPFLWDFVAFARRRVVLDVGLLQVLIHVHNSRHVVATITIVRGRKDCRNVLVVSVCVSLNNRKNTSIISWWARAIIFRLFVWLNCSAMSWPKVYPAPRGFIPHPALSSGSDHSKSHIGPSCGTYWNLLRALMLSRVSMLGDSPPCRQKNWFSTTAVRGR